ncbi:MAG: tetratricopeptide repeat protein [Alphaproteobacteria bacterium]
MDEATTTLIGKKVGFAGRLLSCDRRLASRLVRSAGGRVARGDSADVVVVGDGVRLPPQPRVRTLTESQFLSLVRPVELDRADSVGRLVSAAEVARLFPHVNWSRRRSLAKQGLIHPVHLPNGMGFSFADLRVLRQVDELLADGNGLAQAVARLVPRLAGQLEFRFPRARFSPRPRTADLGAPPSTAEAWFEIGACADRDRAGFPTAIAAYLRALEIDRDHVPSLINLGNVHYEIGEFGRARDLYARAARVDPENPRTHFNLGNACDELSDLLGALRAYRRAIASWPGYADAHFNLALVAEKLDSWTLARRHWRRFLDLEPRSEWAAVARSHLEDAQARALRSAPRARAGLDADG